MGGDKLYLGILGEGEFTIMKAEYLFDGHNQEGQRDNSDVRKLAIAFKGSTNISVAITPMADGKMPEAKPCDKPLAEW